MRPSSLRRRAALAAIALSAAAAAAYATAPNAAAAERPQTRTAERLHSLAEQRTERVRSRHAAVRRTSTPRVVETLPPAGDPYIATAGDDGTAIQWTDTKTRATGLFTDIPDAAEISISADGTEIAFLYDDGDANGVGVVNATTGSFTSTTSVDDESDIEFESPMIDPNDDNLITFSLSGDDEDAYQIDTDQLNGGEVSFTNVDSSSTEAYAPDSSVLYSTDDENCALFEAGNSTTCLYTATALNEATGVSGSEIDEIGAANTLSAIPVEVDYSSDDVHLTSELGVVDASGSGSITLLPSTRATATFTDDAANDADIAGTLDVTPTLDLNNSQLIYGAVSFTADDASSVEWAADTATGTHRAPVLAGVLSDGVGSYFPSSAAPTPSEFVSLDAPVRILDTRTGVGTGGRVAPLSSAAPLDLQVTGADVPSNATAVVLNVTAIHPTATSSYLQVYPTPASGSAFPTVSNIDILKGQALPNAVTVALPASGKIRIRTNNGSVNVAADVSGYYIAPGSAPAGASLFTPEATPVRILDTRSGIGGVPIAPLGAGGYDDVDVESAVNGESSPVPADATAVVLSVGAIEHVGSAFVTAYPATGTTPPTTSTLDLGVKGSVTSNLATVPVPADGEVRFYNSANSADVFADLVGYYQPAAGGGDGFVPVSPSRVFDTRSGTNTVNGQVATLPANRAADLRTAGQITTQFGNNLIAAGADAVAVNLTAVAPTASTYESLFATPAGAASNPTFSTIDVPRGATLASAAITAIGSGGQSRIYNYNGSVGLIVDLAGYFIPEA